MAMSNYEELNKAMLDAFTGGRRRVTLITGRKSVTEVPYEDNLKNAEEETDFKKEVADVKQKLLNDVSSTTNPVTYQMILKKLRELDAVERELLESEKKAQEEDIVIPNVWDTMAYGITEYISPDHGIVQTFKEEVPYNRYEHKFEIKDLVTKYRPLIIEKSSGGALADFLHAIGYPQPYPTVFQVKDILYTDGKVEIITSDETEPEEQDSGIGHGVQQPRREESRFVGSVPKMREPGHKSSDKHYFPKKPVRTSRRDVFGNNSSST